MAKLNATKNKVDDAQKVIAQIEDENMRTLNTEVEVAEDGIVHDVPLLAGYVDPETGVCHDTFSFREMDGRDEEAINKQDVRANGAKMVNVLCERCVVQIGSLTKKECGTVKWGQIIRNMLGGDLDYMAFKIRELSKGGKITFTHTCPSCGTKLKTEMDTNEFPVKPFMGSYTVDFTLMRGYTDKKGDTYKEGTLRLPTGFDRELVVPSFKKNRVTATTLLMTRLLSFGSDVIITRDDINKMTVRDRDIIEGIMTDNAFGIDTSLEGLVCDNCGSVLDGVGGTSDFF